MQTSNAHHNYGTFFGTHTGEKTSTHNVHINKHSNFGSMMDQIKATPTPQTAQETTQPTPGNNSAAIADWVSENMDLLRSGLYEEKFPKLVLFKDRSHLAGKLTAGQLTRVADYDKSKDSPRISKEEVDKINNDIMLERDPMRYLQAFLRENRITLSSNEKFNISVDKYCNITVTGDDAEKAKAIEKLLNSPGGKNWGVYLQRNAISPVEIQENSARISKMLLENYIVNASGGTVSLENLYLLDNDRIMGLPPELDELINSMETRYFGETRQYWEKQAIEVYDYAKANGYTPNIFKDADGALKAFNEGNKEEAVKLAVDFMFQQNDKFTDIKSELTNILKKGVNNIPDMTASMVLGSNSLVFV